MRFWDASAVIPDIDVVARARHFTQIRKYSGMATPLKGARFVIPSPPSTGGKG